MSHFKRVKKALAMGKTISNLKHDEPPVTDVPRVSLLHVEPSLDMQQSNGPLQLSITEHQNGLAIDSSPGRGTRSSPAPANGEVATPEWSSAVGHATTGKSSRVIHNLQEEIARLTRECSLYRSRAEETQRSNEALKAQLQSTTERLRNSEQSNEATLNSMARKDRRIEEIRVEIQSEKSRRQNAELETAKIHQLMLEAQADFNRKSSELQEITNYARTQYDALARASQREKVDLQKKFMAMRNDFLSLRHENEKKDIHLERLEVIIAQKNREIEAGRERVERLFEVYESYKDESDREIRQLIERGHRNEETIDAALLSLKETEGRMKWAIRVKEKIDWAE